MHGSRARPEEANQGRVGEIDAGRLLIERVHVGQGTLEPAPCDVAVLTLVALERQIDDQRAQHNCKAKTATSQRTSRVAESEGFVPNTRFYYRLRTRMARSSTAAELLEGRGLFLLFAFALAVSTAVYWPALSGPPIADDFAYLLNPWITNSERREPEGTRRPVEPGYQQPQELRARASLRPQLPVVGASPGLARLPPRELGGTCARDDAARGLPLLGRRARDGGARGGGDLSRASRERRSRGVDVADLEPARPPFWTSRAPRPFASSGSGDGLRRACAAFKADGCLRGSRGSRAGLVQHGRSRFVFKGGDRAALGVDRRMVSPHGALHGGTSRGLRRLGPAATKRGSGRRRAQHGYLCPALPRDGVHVVRRGSVPGAAAFAFRWRPLHTCRTPATVAALAVRLVVTLCRRSTEAVGWVWSAAAFAPVSQIVPFLYPVADRYLYFMLPGILLASCIAGQDLLERFADLRRRLYLSRGLLALGLAATVLFGVRSSERVRLWRSEDALMADAARAYPDGVSSLVLRAQSAALQGDTSTTITLLRTASQRDWDYWNFVLASPAFQQVRDDPRFKALIADLAEGFINKVERRSRPTQLELLQLAQAHAIRGETEAAAAAIDRGLALGGPLEGELRTLRASLKQAGAPR